MAVGCGGARRAERATAAEKIRKQVYELRPADLERFRIWEHALDEEGEPGQDEETVKPRPDLREGDPRDGLLLVRAEFVARDGTRYTGYAYPSFDYGLRHMAPTIVTNRGQVIFWYGLLAPRRSRIDRAYRLLGKGPEELFPVRFHALVPTKGAKLAGEIRAFAYLRSARSDEVAEVR